MMKPLAGWLDANRPLRIALVVALFPLPFMAIGSAGTMTAITLLQGWRVALQDAVAATAVLGILGAVLGMNWTALVGAASVTWIAAIVAGHLRRQGSLTLAVQVIVLVAAAGAGAFVVLQADPQAFWEQMLREFAQAARQTGLEVLPEASLADAASLMTGVLAASAIVSSVLALVLGCWLAEAGDGQAPAADEFRGLRMGRLVGWIALAVAAMAILGLAGADDVLLPLGMGFVLQGLAVVHWHARERDWPAPWALAIYLPLVLAPVVAVVEVVLLGLVGVVDNGAGLRRTGKGVV